MASRTVRPHSSVTAACRWTRKTEGWASGRKSRPRGSGEVLALSFVKRPRRTRVTGRPEEKALVDRVPEQAELGAAQGLFARDRFRMGHRACGQPSAHRRDAHQS